MASKLTLYRGASYDEELPLGMDLTGCTVYFTVKPSGVWQTDTDTSDTAASISKDITVHDDAPEGITRLTLTSEDTDVTPGEYQFDVHVKNGDGEVFVYEPAKFIIKPTVTLRS